MLHIMTKLRSCWDCLIFTASLAEPDNSIISEVYQYTSFFRIP